MCRRNLRILAVCTEAHSLPAFAPWHHAPVCSRVAAAAEPCGGKAADAMMTMVMRIVIMMVRQRRSRKRRRRRKIMQGMERHRQGHTFLASGRRNRPCLAGAVSTVAQQRVGRVSSTGMSTPRCSPTCLHVIGHLIFEGAWPKQSPRCMPSRSELRHIQSTAWRCSPRPVVLRCGSVPWSLASERERPTCRSHACAHS